MERDVREVQAADGVRIAYWTLGEGEPLVYMAGGPWNHIEAWEVAQCRAWYERLAQERMVVRYDARGTGLSQRDVSDLSVDGQVRDVEAVVEATGLRRFSIFAAGDAGPAAIAYAVQNPDRVASIVLWCSWAKGSTFEVSPRIQAWRGLIDDDWDLMVETCAHLAFGWSSGAVGQQAAAAFKASITCEGAKAALQAMISADVRHLLDQVRAPVLVLHRSGVSWLPVEIATDLAASIANSRLVILEGETTAPYLGDAERLAATIEAFVEDPQGFSAEAGVQAQPGRGPRVPMTVWPGQRSNGLVEILPFHLSANGRIVRYATETGASWQVAFDPARHPGDVARSALAQLAIEPLVIHSTSWRFHDDSLVLTYATVLSEPVEAGGVLVEASVRRGGLAVGTAVEAPGIIRLDDVVEHALRHLAWLAEKDEPIGRALGKQWRAALRELESEPFSAFDLTGALSNEDGSLMSARYARPLAAFVSEGGQSAEG